MISPNDMLVTKYDLTLFTTFLVVGHLVENQLLKTALFTETWMTSAVSLLIGVALHGLVTNKISSALNTQLKVNNPRYKLAMYDLVKWVTIFVTQKVVSSVIAGQPIVFDQRWMMTSSLTTAGYMAFDVFIQQMVPKVDAKHKSLIDDLVKVSLGGALAIYGVDRTFNRRSLIELGGVLVGFVVFHLVTKKVVMSK